MATELNPDELFSSKMALPLAITGVSAHLLYWIHGEKSMQAVRTWLWGHFAVNIVLLLLAIRQSTMSILHSLVAVLLLNIYFYLPLFTSVALYRLVFHRLRAFPGPVSLRISKLVAAYANIEKNQDVQRIWALHKRYGNIIRVGPRELSILDAAALPLIYGASSGCTRGPWYDREKSTEGHEKQEFQLFQLRDPEQHAERKKAVWDKAFNISSLKDYEPSVHATCREFISALAQHTDESLSGPEVAKLLAYDLMGTVGWGQTFHNSQNWKLHPALEFIDIVTARQQIVSQAPWVMNLLVNLSSDSSSRPYAKWIRDKVIAKRQQTVPGTDAMSKIIHNRQALTLKTLCDEGKLMVIAGGDTVSTVSASIIFHLARNPRVQRKLQEELDAVGGLSNGDFEYRSISSLPYLDAVVQEGLRIQPPVQGGIQRVTPSDGLRLDDGTFIPGETIVSIPTMPLQRDPRYFAQPEEYLPERWTEEREKIMDRTAFMPFSMGSYMCVGRGLAVIEMKTMLSMMFSGFNVRLADGEDGRKFLEETEDCQITHLGDFQVVFSKRI
ncbi:hypothetical protein ACMFMG_004580 [Clarireedia jacksonii]